MTIRVLLADDEALIRAGLRLVLRPEADVELVGEAADGAAAVEQAARLAPDVVVMDVRMPGVDGLEATRRILAEAPGARVLILTTFGEDRDVYAALRAGASGFLLKDSAPEDLVHAIRVVARGDALLGPATTRQMVEAFVRGPAPRVEPAPVPLAAREREVIALVAVGRTNAEIAAELGLSESTVKTHLARAQRKLGVRDRVGVVIWAYETGLVRTPPNATRPDEHVKVRPPGWTNHSV
jgi:DNA-binding NarL/FixJ family response regulator